MTSKEQAIFDSQYQAKPGSTCTAIINGKLHEVKAAARLVDVRKQREKFEKFTLSLKVKR